MAFLGTDMMARLLGLIKVGGVSLHALSYRTFFKPFEPQVASFLWALAFIGVWLGILWVLDRKGIVLKVCVASFSWAATIAINNPIRASKEWPQGPRD